MGLEDDKMEAHQIPLVEVLCRELGLEGRNSKRSIRLRRSLIAWRKDYKTPSGVPGTSITRWDSKEDREYLGLMALAYLETDGHGRKYWPPGGFYESPDGFYVYPQDLKE